MRLPRQRQGRGPRAAFTLVELLVVVAIMGILLVLALPAFETMGRRSLTTVTPNLMSTIRLARQYAITHRKYVWVVFPDRRNTSYTGSEALLALRAYAVVAGDRTTGPTEYISEWRYLPQGLYFDDTQTLFENVFDSVGGGTSYFPFPDDKETDDHNMPSIQFRPNGRAYYYTAGGTWVSFGRRNIYWRQAVVNVNTNAGSVSAPVYTSTTSASVRVMNATGQVNAHAE